MREQLDRFHVRFGTGSTGKGNLGESSLRRPVPFKLAIADLPAGRMSERLPRMAAALDPSSALGGHRVRLGVVSVRVGKLGRVLFSSVHDPILSTVV
jgi:hypothetical protein